MVQKSYSGVTRAEAIRRIFTEGVKEYVKESGLPMGEALAKLTQANLDLWVEYRADNVPVQGIVLENPASSALAAEMNAYAEKHDCSLAVALAEVSKSNPSLYQEYLDGVAVIV